MCDYDRVKIGVLVNRRKGCCTYGESCPALPFIYLPRELPRSISTSGLVLHLYPSSLKPASPCSPSHYDYNLLNRRDYALFHPHLLLRFRLLSPRRSFARPLTRIEPSQRRCFDRPRRHARCAPGRPRADVHTAGPPVRGAQMLRGPHVYGVPCIPALGE